MKRGTAALKWVIQQECFFVSRTQSLLWPLVTLGCSPHTAAFLVFVLSNCCSDPSVSPSVPVCSEEWSLELEMQRIFYVSGVCVHLNPALTLKCAVLCRSTWEAQSRSGILVSLSPGSLVRLSGSFSCGDAPRKLLKPVFDVCQPIPLPAYSYWDIMKGRRICLLPLQRGIFSYISYLF